MDRTQASQVTTGLVVVAVGLMLLAGQLDLGWAWDFGRLWPVILIIVGVGRFIKPGEEGRGSAVWFIFVGALLLMHTNRILRLHDSWPLFIVAAGLSIMLKRGRTSAGPAANQASVSGDRAPSADHARDGRFQP